MIEQFEIDTINELEDSFELSELIWNYDLLTDIELAKLAYIIYMEFQENNLMNASHEAQKEYLSEVFLNDEYWLATWAYDGNFYWAGFAYKSNLAYPWKVAYTTEASYNDATYSIRPVVTISTSYLEQVN